MSGATPPPETLAGWARDALAAEAEAITVAAKRLNGAFAAATTAILARSGKVVVTGLGKSGHIARKIASTLASTGTSSFFLHPTEALHGDFGMLQPTDSLVAIAYGGETHEVLEVCRFARRLGIPVIGITGKLDSSLAQLSNFVLDGRVEREADSLNLAPTCSSTLAMALGDALAVTLMRARGFSQGDFASLHPGGSLGRRLSLVRDHMHGLDRVAQVRLDADFHEIIEAVTVRNFGVAAVVDADHRLLGAISDGDLRRALVRLGGDALQCSARDLMTATPKTVQAQALALDALTLMNEKQITQLFVLEAGDESPRRLVGVVRMHDLLAAKIL
jgi:arabinose-5-phosphate isomerase